MPDLFNGEIITYTIDSWPVYTLVSNMLDQAFKRLAAEDSPLIHSDQGWHYRNPIAVLLKTWYPAKYVAQRELLR